MDSLDEFVAARWPHEELRPAEVRVALVSAVAALDGALGTEAALAVLGPREPGALLGASPLAGDRSLEVRLAACDLASLVRSAEQYGGRSAKDCDAARGFVPALRRAAGRLTAACLRD